MRWGPALAAAALSVGATLALVSVPSQSDATTAPGSTATPPAAVPAPLLTAAAVSAHLPTATTGPAAGAPSRSKEVVAHPRAVRSWEWRRLDRTPVTQLATAFARFRAMGGTTVAVDISYVVDISEIADPGARAAAQGAYTQRLRQYVAAAARAGLTVEAAAGSPHWVSPDVRYATDIVWSFVTGFNASAPAGQRLVGVHFDLEPWGTPQWRTDAPTLARHLVETVAQIAARQRSTAAAKRVPVSVDLPFWLDGTTAPKTLRFNGRTASPTQHVIRLLDNGAGRVNSVVIMAYRDTTGGVDGSVPLSAGEITLADTFAGRVLVTIGQEVGAVSPERITFFEEGRAALAGALSTLRSTFGRRTGFGGFAIDDLASLAKLTE